MSLSPTERAPSRRTSWRLVAGALLSLAPASAKAQAPETPSSPQAMSLDDALGYARAHQPAIRGALARFNARHAEARIPKAGWLPQVGATAQILYGTANNTSASYLSVPEVDVPRVGGTKSPSPSGASWTPEASTIAAVGLTQEIWDFGRIFARTAAADALADSARADADAVRLDVDLGVEESYDAVLAAHGVLQATEEAWKRAAAHRDFAQAGVKSGMWPPIDLTRAAAELADADVRRIRARTALVVARGALAASMGSDQLQVDAVVPHITSQVSQNATLPSSVIPEIRGLREAIDLAEKKNPAVIGSLARVSAQEAATRAIGREMLPNLWASAGLSARAGGTSPSSGSAPYGDGWLPDVANWHVGVVLEWNLFDATIVARKRASKAREDEARADVATIEQNVLFAVERAWLELQGAVAVVPGLAQAVEAARANQEQADARFQAGLGTIVELTDAESVLTGAEVELAIARFDVDRARSVLARAIGDASARGANP